MFVDEGPSGIGPEEGVTHFVLVIRSLAVGLWLTDRGGGLPTTVVALFPAIAFTVTGVLDQTDMNRLEWTILVLIGGIARGASLQKVGLDILVVEAVPLENRFVGIGLAKQRWL